VTPELCHEQGRVARRWLPGRPAAVHDEGGAADVGRLGAEQERHHSYAPHITVHGDEATGRVHFQFQASGVDEWGRTSSRAVSGYFDIGYVRTAEGGRIRAASPPISRRRTRRRTGTSRRPPTSTQKS
jgi:hypothetical protein